MRVSGATFQIATQPDEARTPRQPLRDRRFGRHAEDQFAQDADLPQLAEIRPQIAQAQGGMGKTGVQGGENDRGGHA